MQIGSRLVALLPLLLSIVAAVLSALCLFAGHSKGYMEDYALARVNTSGLGKNFFTDDNSSDDPKDAGILGDIEGALDKAKDKIEDDLHKLSGDIADALADTLGISEWYSVHVLDACYGMYKPKATAPNAGLNTTNCTSSSPDNRFNLTKMLDHDLQVGPFDLNLADLNWPPEFQEGLDKLNDVLLALFVVYVLGIVFSGISFLTAILAFVFAGKRWLIFVNSILTGLAALFIMIASIVVTVAANKGISKMNSSAKDIGVHVQKGNKFLAMTWAATAVMIVATLVWQIDFCVACCGRRKSSKELPKEQMLQTY